jgi:arylsulfatase A-like enzyme
MKRTALIFALSFASALTPASAALAAGKPNVVFILTDDQGYGEVGMQAHRQPPVVTPHIDRLAREGVRFTQAYSNSHVCAPARAAFLTGRYPHRFGFHGNGDADPGMPRTEKLLPAPAHPVMHWLLGGNHAVRRGDWKYVRQENEDFLFNLRSDREEANNLAHRHPERLAELRALHLAWAKGLPPRLGQKRLAAPVTR